MEVANAQNALFEDYKKLFDENITLKNQLTVVNEENTRLKNRNTYDLLQACENDNLNTVKTIARNNNFTFNFGDGNNKALLIATKRNNLKIVKYLIEHGVDKYGYLNKCEVLLIASELGYFNMVQYLIPYFITYREVKNKALEKAAQNGHLKIVKYLHKIGANINTRNCGFHSTSDNKHLDVIKYFYKAGFDISNKTEALQNAAYHGHLKVVKYLYKIGADIHADNNIALQFAADQGHTKVVKYINSLLYKKSWWFCFKN